MYRKPLGTVDLCSEKSGAVWTRFSVVAGETALLQGTRESRKQKPAETGPPGGKIVNNLEPPAF